MDCKTKTVFFILLVWNICVQGHSGEFLNPVCFFSVLRNFRLVPEESKQKENLCSSNNGEERILV